MTRFILAALAALALLAPAAADAHTTIIEPVGSHFPYQQWADEAKVPTPDVTLTVIETEGLHGCPGRDLDYQACTAPAEGKIWISPSAIQAGGAREIFYHEIGHNVDADVLAPWMREHFMAIYGLSGPWVLEGEPAPFGPNEMFAEVYKECAFAPTLQRGRLGTTGLPGSSLPLGGFARHNAVCRMLGKL